MADTGPAELREWRRVLQTEVWSGIQLERMCLNRRRTGASERCLTVPLGGIGAEHNGSGRGT